MRKLILSIMISVDGYMEDAREDIGWHNWTSEMDDFMGHFLDSVDTILLGRKTYENMAAYWPKLTFENQKIAHSMNLLPKIVLSTTISSSTWNNTHFISENAADTIMNMKEENGKDIVAFGGAKLASFLVTRNLIDQYRMIINPVILGKGTAIFNELENIKILTFKKAISFACGITMLIYHTKQ